MLSAGAGKTNVFETIAAAGGAWTFIKSQTAGSLTASVAFVNGTSDVVLDSTYVMYKLIGYNIIPETDDTMPRIQFSTDAGSSYITSGYDTQVSRQRSGVGYSLTEATDGAMDANSVGNDAATEGADFEWTLMNPAGTTYTKYWFKVITRDHVQRVAHHSGGGILETAGDVDAIQVLQSSDDIMGTFILYGLKGS